MTECCQSTLERHECPAADTSTAFIYDELDGIDPDPQRPSMSVPLAAVLEVIEPFQENAKVFYFP